MFSSRRAFVSGSLAGLAASRFFPHVAGAADVDLKTALLPSSGEYGFQPSTLFLTWQRDPTTTMTIQWIGTIGETSDTKVYYSRTKPETIIPAIKLSSLPVSGVAAVGAVVEAAKKEIKADPWKSQAPKIKPYPMTDLKVFRVELTGLEPGTDYSFRIGSQSPTYRFRTMPAKATDTIHFISGGDCGINNHAIANNIQAARQDPMFSVIGGDLGYDNGKSVEISLAFIRNYSRTMIGRDGRLIPMLACLGNHEVDGGYNKPREKAPFFYALFDGLYNETSYNTLDFGDYLSLVLLDTGHISPIGGRANRLAGKNTGGPRRSPKRDGGEPCARVSFRPQYARHNHVGWQGCANRHRRRESQALGAAVRETSRAGGVGAS